MYRPFPLVHILLICACVGCRARQLQTDQDQIRVAIMDMYSNQIMDNLIRAHDGYPFVQIDYTSVTGQITQAGNGSLSATFLAHAFTPWTLGVGGTQNNQLSVNAVPVLDDDELYYSYIRFARDPNKFIVTCDPPPEGAAHMCVCCNKRYYWVPLDQADEYQALAMSVTVARGKNHATVTDYYVAKVLGFVRTETFVKDEEASQRSENGKLTLTHFNYYIELDSEIPNNDDGKLKAVINSSFVEFNVTPVDKEQMKEIKDAKTRNIVRISASGVNIVRSDLLQLAGQTVKIKLATTRPTAPTEPEDALKSIQRDVQLFRMNQFLVK